MVGFCGVVIIRRTLLSHWGLRLLRLLPSLNIHSDPRVPRAQKTLNRILSTSREPSHGRRANDEGKHLVLPFIPAPHPPNRA
jgi:hypothetical protein